jgi:hypothetical protein
MEVGAPRLSGALKGEEGERKLESQVEMAFWRGLSFALEGAEVPRCVKSDLFQAHEAPRRSPSRPFAHYAVGLLRVSRAYARNES